MYKDVLSSRLSVNAGMQQGPVLGTLLFLTYVNDDAQNICPLNL